MHNSLCKKGNLGAKPYFFGFQKWIAIEQIVFFVLGFTLIIQLTWFLSLLIHSAVKVDRWNKKIAIGYPVAVKNYVKCRNDRESISA